jgi:hypothetical protein
MELLIGLIAGIVIVVIIIAVCIIYTRSFPERRKPTRRGDGRYSIGPISDNYAEPHVDNHGGPY